MSLLDRRRFFRIGLAAGASLTVAACFRPLNGPTASGQNLAAILASIDVEKLSVPMEHEELAHELRSELIYLLNGSGVQTAKNYRLTLSYTQIAASPLIDAETGRATTSTITGSVDYTLYDRTNKIVGQGRVQAMVTYERPAQRFASIRALRDAKLRLAKELASHVKIRLASTLSAR